VVRATPFFLTFCLQIHFRLNFFISLLFHLFLLILTCSCQYSYNLMLTSNCMCRPYIGIYVGHYQNTRTFSCSYFGNIKYFRSHFALAY
jgi:hypothetical protein